MTFGGLVLDADSRNTILLLLDPSKRRQVPLWISHAQAEGLQAVIKKDGSVSTSNYQLMMQLIKVGGLHLDKVFVRKTKKRRYQSLLSLSILNQEDTKDSSSTLEIKAELVDGVALAISSNCKVFMNEADFADESIAINPSADDLDVKEFRQFLSAIKPIDLIKHSQDQENPSQESMDFPNSKSSD